MHRLLIIALTFLPPVALAVLLQEVPRGKIFFRTLYYLPAVITSLVVVLLWKSFYGPTERGVLNAVLMRIPAIGYLLTGMLLLWLCAAFFRRLSFHGHRLVGGCRRQRGPGRWRNLRWPRWQQQRWSRLR